MWRLLKAELRYTMGAWLFAYAICMVFFYAAARGNWDIVGFMLNTTFAYGIAMGVIGAQADGEKRTRANALLPLRPRQLGLIDVLCLMLFQLGMVVLWIALLAVKPESPTATTFWGMLSHNGLTLSMITLFVVHTHLGFFGTRRYRLFTYAVPLLLGVSIALLVYTGNMRHVARYLGRHYLSWSGALASTLLWLALSYLSVILYERRKSYLA